MPWRQFLSQFRPAAVPGAAGPGAVPADRAAEAAAELEPVFALLAGTEAEADRILSDAVQQAARIRHDADRAAAALLADAVARAPAARAAAARDAAAAAAPVAAGAADDAAQARLVRERLPGLVEDALAEVRALVWPAGTGPVPADAGEHRG